jgi:hypothetical protein
LTLLHCCCIAAASQALQQQLSPQERLKLEQQLLKKGETELSIKSALQRIELMSQLWHIKQQQGNDAVPVVAGITFAAPRVGNPAYANAFKARSLIDPLSVKEPLLDSKYKDSMVSTTIGPLASEVLSTGGVQLLFVTHSLVTEVCIA